MKLCKSYCYNYNRKGEILTSTIKKFHWIYACLSTVEFSDYSKYFVSENFLLNISYHLGRSLKDQRRAHSQRMDVVERELPKTEWLNVFQIGYYNGVADHLYKSMHVHVCRRTSRFLYSRVVTTPLQLILTNISV